MTRPDGAAGDGRRGLLGLRGALGLRGRFAAVVAVVVVPFGLTTTHLAVAAQVSALEQHLQQNALDVLRLLDSGVTNLVASGDVAGVHDVLADVRRQATVTEAYVIDDSGTVLADGTEDEARRHSVLQLPGVLRDEVGDGSDPVLAAADGHLDTALPLDVGATRLGYVVVRHSLAETTRQAAATRRNGFVVGGLFTVLALLAVGLLAGRLTRALEVLTRAARRAASYDLPQVLEAVREGRAVTADLLPAPVDVGGRGEARELADALNTYRLVVTDMAGDLARLLRERDSRFRSAFDGSPLGMALLGSDQQPVAVNEALCRLLARTSDELAAGPLTQHLHPEDAQPYEQRLRVLLAGPAPTTPLEVRFVRADGSVVWTIASLAVHRDEDGVVQNVFVQLLDATARRRAESDLRRLAYHDPLTGLPNRSYLLDTLDRALARARRDGTCAGLLLLDVDHFKVVNDSLGHDAGDLLLREVSTRLSAAVRAGDTVARFGGDEFVVIAEPDCPEDEAVALAARIGAALRAPMTLDGRDVHVSASIGVAVSTASSDSRSLLRDADTAAYWAKARGRSRHELFTAELRQRADARLEVEQDLRQALDRDEILPFYQPVVSTSTGTVLGFEALVRWQHPTRGLLSPADFLDVAVETGLVVRLGSAVLARACADLATWDRLGAERPWISVNIDAQQLHLDGFADDVGAVLRDTGTDPDRVRLELTEGAFLDLTSVEATRKLRALGVRLAVDDFGTGYSSLHYLRRLPVDILKIDRSFLEGIDNDVQAQAVVRAIVELSHAIDLTVVAEGVETPAQLAALEGMGCDASQGYLLARPMPTASVPGYLLGLHEAAPAPRLGSDAVHPA